MRVRVISFGTNWWAMHSSDEDDPYRFKRNAAYFNAAAIMCGRRLRHCAIYPGQIRFNANSGFDPEFPGRAIGQTFLCSGPNEAAGRVHLLFVSLLRMTAPDAYLVTLNSLEHGTIHFGAPGWRSPGVRPISISVRGPRFEAMLLIGVGEWIRSDCGRWQMDVKSNRLFLTENEKEVPQ